MMGPEVLGRLMDKHAPALVLYARQWCAAPEDVVQEAFIKLLAQKASPESPVSWLYRVVRNAALDALRKEQRRRHHESVAARETAPWFQPGEDNLLDADMVADALTTLPADEREIITLHLWGGLTFEQIADVTGLSAS